jgi:hypothetical protein
LIKIKYEELKLLYRDHIRSQLPASRLNCPSLEKIYNSLKVKSSRRYRIGLIDHISHCRFCLDDFDILRSFLLIEKTTLAEINQVISSAKKQDARLREERDGYRQENKHIPFHYRKIIAFSLAMLAIAFLVLGLFTNRQLLNKILFSDQNRSPLRKELVLLHPECNREHAISSLIFKWKSIPRSDFYVIEIFDETLLPIWKSPPIFESFFAFPTKIPDIIKPQKVYFWMVTAFKSDKIRLESNIHCFYFR